MKKAALFVLVCLAAFAAFVAYRFATQSPSKAKHTIVVRYWSEQAVPFDTISMAIRVVGMQESYEGPDSDDLAACGPKVKECEKTIRTDKDVKGVRLTIMGMAMIDGQMAILPYCFEPDEKDSKTKWELAGNVRVTLDGKEYPLAYRPLTFEQDGQMHTQCATVAAFSGEPPDVIND